MVRARFAVLDHVLSVSVIDITRVAVWMMGTLARGIVCENVFFRTDNDAMETTTFDARGSITCAAIICLLYI